MKVKKVLFYEIKKLLSVIAFLFVFCMLPLLNAQVAPVGEWRFDESSGTTAADESTNSNNGTLTNMTSPWIPGLYSNALEFDGVNDYVSTNYAFSGTELTYSFWVYPEGNEHSVNHIICGNNYTNRIGYTNNNVIIFYITSAGASAISPALTLNQDEWNYVAFTAKNNGSNIDWFCTVNGNVDSGTKTGYNLASHTSMNIGKWDAASYDLHGILDDVKIYDEALAADELLLLSQESRYVAHLRLDGNANDSGRYGNDGTLNAFGTPIWDTGEKSGALEFDGFNDYISISNDKSLQITGDLTIALWIKPDGVIGSGTNTSLVHKYQKSEYSVSLFSDGSIILSMGNGTKSWSERVIPAGSIVNDQWQHIVITRNIATRCVKGYIDGELVGKRWFDTDSSSIYYPFITSTLPIMIGYGYLPYYKGLIDDVVIADYTFTDEEVREQWDSAFLRGFWKMDTGEGIKVTDLSEYNNHGNFTDMASYPWVDGVLGDDGYFHKALNFDGNNDYISIDNDSSLQITGDLSISLWIKPDGVVGGTQRISVVHKSYGGEFSVTLEPDGSMYLFQGKSTQSGENYGYAVIPDGSIVNDQWQHVVFTRDMTTRDLKGYLDGELLCTRTYPDDSNYSPPATTTSPVTIGYGYLYDYNGEIDDVRIYSRVLDAEEVIAEQKLFVYQNRNYYTSEDPVAICSLDIDSSTGLTNCYLVVKDSQGNSLGTDNTPEKETDLTYDISSLANGNHTITVELRRNTGEKMYSCDFDIIKKASFTGTETKINCRNSTVLRDGVAFFPIGFVMDRVTSGDTAIFQEIENIGFNAMMHWDRDTPSGSATYLQNAGDLLVVDRHEDYTSYNIKIASEDADDFWDAYISERSNILSAVDYAKQEDNLLAYNSFDEPKPTQVLAGMDLYEQTNSRDGYHPVVANYSSWIPAGEEYTNWCDILCIDPYWIPPVVDDTLRTKLHYVTRCLWDARKRAKENFKALWVMPMSEYYSGCRKRAQTPGELRVQTYLSMIHGAKGIFYYFYPIFHNDTWTEMTNLAEEIEIISPSLLTQELEQTISYSTGEFNPSINKYVDVQVSLFEAPPSASYDYVLLAANTQIYPVDLEFDISLLGSSGTVNRLSSILTRPIVNGVFDDQLEGYGTRAYTFSSTSTEPITIDVNLTTLTNEDPVQPVEIAPHPDAGRTGFTNLMQNPDLEANYIKNWPDYCFLWQATPRINSTNQGWGLVTTSTIPTPNTGLPTGSGSTCLEISRDNPSHVNGFYFRVVPKVTIPTNYTFSVYLKAKTAGTKVQLGNSGIGNTGEITLSNTSWTRCSYTCSVPVDFDSGYHFYVYLMDDNRTIWADAVQVEVTTAKSPISFTKN